MKECIEWKKKDAQNDKWKFILFTTQNISRQHVYKIDNSLSPLHSKPAHTHTVNK